MKKIWLLTLLFSSAQVSAVFINPKGLGEAAIIPFYTVNNNLNTLVSFTNTTDNGKAIKITIRERLHGYAALSYNVYLNAFDTWTFVLVSTESTVSGYAGQPSANHVTSDNSCAPYLVNSGQQFLPFDLADGPSDLSRTREGFIEIIEMGSIYPGTSAFTNSYHGGVGVPANCSYFEQAWEENGLWHEASGGNSQAELSPTSGGLMTEAQIIDVTEGISYSIPTIALDGFHANETIVHVNPGDTSLSLDAAAPVAQIIADSQIYQLQFNSGIDAVSAVLMSDKLIATYALDSIVVGKSEIIYTQPTRRFYVDYNDNSAEPPYNLNTVANNIDCPFSYYGGVEISQVLFDRESQYEIIDDCAGIDTCPPPRPKPSICGTVFVQGIHMPTFPSHLPERPFITDSPNSVITMSPSVGHATENGFSQNEFINTRPLVGIDINTDNTVGINGIPIIGVSLQRYTNAGAAEGLLAQYGGAQMVKSTVSVIEHE